eukprot:3229757-Pleurochrysis_carterae.AAC.4
MAGFVEFEGNLKDNLHFHKHKLHTIVFNDKLHPAVRRQYAKKLNDDKAAAADKEARMKEWSVRLASGLQQKGIGLRAMAVVGRHLKTV